MSARKRELLHCVIYTWGKEAHVSSRNNNATVQCPVEAGPYKVTQTVELPREIPHGELPVAQYPHNGVMKLTLYQPNLSSQSVVTRLTMRI